MDRDKARVSELIEKEFGPRLQEDAIRHLWKPYELAWAQARELHPAQQRKCYGNIRLALIEDSFKLFCRKHPEVTARDYRPAGMSYDFFTMQTKSLVITVKAVNAPKSMPPLCEFRETLAEGTQYDAFQNVTAVDGRRFYHVLLVHNCGQVMHTNTTTGLRRVVRQRNRPGFIELLVPERNGTECIERRSLFLDFPHIISELRGVKVEGLDNKRIPRRKKRADEETGTGS